MFESTSRYFNLPTTTLTVRDAEGKQRIIAYKRRRFIPPSSDLPPLVEHQVTQGDRLDNLTARYLADPTQFWRVCDVNLVLEPVELEEVGRLVKITLPQW